MSTWIPYLIDPKFRDEPELRNKIGVIWLASLLDSIEGGERVLAKYRHAAIDHGVPGLVSICDKAEDFMAAIKEVLRLYSKTDLLFIRDLRDQWVHSWLARRHSATLKVKIFDGCSVVAEQMTASEYNSQISRYYEQPLVLDAVLSPLLDRAIKGNLRYWHAIDLLHGQMDLLYKVVIEGVDAEIL